MESIEKVEEWKWLQNEVSNKVMMGSEFLVLSKKYALLFNQIGLSRNNVVHLAVGNKNDVFGILGGIWLMPASLMILLINPQKHCHPSAQHSNNSRWPGPKQNY